MSSKGPTTNAKQANTEWSPESYYEIGNCNTTATSTATATGTTTIVQNILRALQMVLMINKLSFRGNSWAQSQTTVGHCITVHCGARKYGGLQFPPSLLRIYLDRLVVQSYPTRILKSSEQIYLENVGKNLLEHEPTDLTFPPARRFAGECDRESDLEPSKQTFYDPSQGARRSPRTRQGGQDCEEKQIFIYRVPTGQKFSNRHGRGRVEKTSFMPKIHCCQYVNMWNVSLSISHRPMGRQA